MMTKHLTIRLNYGAGLDYQDLPLRYILADTIEERGIGKVINEGAGEYYMEVQVKIDGRMDYHQEIISILESLSLMPHAELIYE